MEQKRSASLPRVSLALASRVIGCAWLAACLSLPAQTQAQAQAPAPPAAASNAAVASSAKQWPPLLQASLEASLDDPELLLAQIQQRLLGVKGVKGLTGVPGPDQDGLAFWLSISAARLQLLLEADDEAAASLRAARKLLEVQARPTPEMQVWLEFTELRHRAINEVNTDALQALASARTRLRVDPNSVLGCEWDATEAWMLSEMQSLEEAWRATESLERCSQATGWPHLRAQALAERAHLAARARASGLTAIGGADPVTAERVAVLFEEAYNAVGPGQGRFARSLIAYAAGLALRELDLFSEASRQLRRALVASRALGDRAGIAASLTALASVDAKEGRHAEALAALAEAEPVLRQIGTGTAARLMLVYTRRLQSLVALRRVADLPAAMAGATVLADRGVPPSVREMLARAMAPAHAALGQHAAAYDWMQRAHRLSEQSRGVASGAQVLRLQTLYDNSNRNSELAALRHAEETARLSLLAQQAAARTLWAVLLASAALVAVVAAVGWRQWSRRREMAELALRDSLTGLANRRATEAYARAQLTQALRLNLPFTVAMIDLDHFKNVNDQHGHATGDAVLRAFASAVPALLRAPDRLGRWGGEEFLLVLPGTALHELPGLFQRLRAAFASAAVPGLPAPHGHSFSMGGAEAGADGLSIEPLIEAADRRLYTAKSTGRDRLG